MQSGIVVLLSLSLLAASSWNSWRLLRQSFHWPLFIEDEMTCLDRDLYKARDILKELDAANIGYHVAEASETDADNFFNLQYVLAPIILWREPSDRRYVLVEFRTTKKVKPLQGLMLLKDFGRGIGLYRKM